MVLVDTSIWVDHLRKPKAELVQLLEAEAVLTHSFVIGELACGTLSNRGALLYNLSRLPHVSAASDSEVLEFIESRIFIAIIMSVTLAKSHLPLIDSPLRMDSGLFTASSATCSASPRLW